jgi:hypothetical protein
MNAPQKPETAMAWYRRDQWELLRAVSADADRLEKTYDEWLAFASEELRKLQAIGLRVQKIDVEVGALNKWCESKARPVDGAARAEYAARGLGAAL